MMNTILNNNSNRFNDATIEINGKHFPGRDEKIPVCKLFSAAHCQRKIKTKEVDKIFNDYDDNLVNLITVSLRDGRYYIIDGQHRVTAIKKKFGSNAIVKCRVIPGLTVKDEAAYFRKINKSQREISSNDDFNSGYYEEDPTIIGIIDIGKKYGISFGNKNLNGMRNIKFRVKAVETAQNIYNGYGKEIFDRICRVLSEGFVDEPSAFNASLMEATAIVLNTYGKDCSDDVLIKKLRSRNPDRLILDARNDRTTGTASTSKKLARILVKSVYNSGRGSKRLDSSKVDF